MPADLKYPVRRAKALVTLAATASIVALMPTSLAFRSAGSPYELTDPDTARIAKMGIDSRFHSETDALGLADLRWEFPRLAAAQLEIGESLVFALPGARAIELTLVDRDWIASDALGFSFNDPASGSSADIVLLNGTASGTVRANIDGRFEKWSLMTGVDHAGIGGDYYSNLDGIEAQSLVTPIDPPSNLAGDGGVAGAGCDDNGSVIDVLFTYTPDFLADYPSLDAMQAAILADLQRMNLAQVNSLSAPRFRSAGFLEIDQPGTGSLATDLTNLANPTDGWADAVHAERDDTRADLVVLYTESGPGSAAFIGVGNQALGFSVVGTQGGYALARALATNMGCCNAPGDSTPACGGAYPFSNAHRFTVGTTTYRTLMALPPGEEIAYFSNPTVDFLGVPTGTATANNSRTMSFTSVVVAGYRCSEGADPDCDGDGVLDTVAIASGLVPDCNLTGIPDSCDIALGISIDLNSDGVPDECPLTDRQFTVSGTGVLDTFGVAVSTSVRAGDPSVLLGIGAPGNDVGAPNAGTAWIVPMTAGVPNLAAAQALRPSDPQQNGFFGRGLSVFKRPSSASPAYPARNYAAVGAYRWNQSASTGNYQSKGALYLFEEGGTGTWAQTLSSAGVPWRYSPPATGGNAAGAYSLFGWSVALGRSPTEGTEIIIVGAPGRNNGQGGVYVLRNQANNTPALHVLRALGSPVDGDEFGYSVTLAPRIGTSGSSRVAFAAGAPGRSNDRGAVLVYERPVSSLSFGTWAAPFTLTTPGTTLNDGDRFGAAVSMIARPATPAAAPTALLAVGAPGDDGGKGRVHFWERGTGTGVTTAWTYRGSYQPLDAKVGDAFGSSVSVALNTAGDAFVITVGAPKTDVVLGSATRVDAGVVYVLTRSFGSTGATLSSLRRAFSPATGDEFGYSASSVTGFGLVGAPFTDSAGLNAGMTRVTINP
ncbi:MAG: hypothetical protein RLY21_1361 [Planctomycetota bacterium]|jgi:hypothetical protein